MTNEYSHHPFYQSINNPRGVVTVELAFSVMVFLLLVFGIIEYGTIVNKRNALTQIVREGASLASRNLTTDANILDLLESTDNSLDMAGNPGNYKIYLARITGGSGGNPISCVVTERGGLSGPAVQAPAPPLCDLPTPLVGYVTEDPALTISPVEGFTVVKVYYQHDPITPFGGMGWMGGDGTNDPTVMWSQAFF